MALLGGENCNYYPIIIRHWCKDGWMASNDWRNRDTLILDVTIAYNKLDNHVSTSFRLEAKCDMFTRFIPGKTVPLFVPTSWEGRGGGGVVLPMINVSGN